MRPLQSVSAHQADPASRGFFSTFVRMARAHPSVATIRKIVLVVMKIRILMIMIIMIYDSHDNSKNDTKSILAFSLQLAQHRLMTITVLIAM